MTGKKTFLTKMMGVFKSMDQMIGPDFEKGQVPRGSASKSASRRT